ncbi:MAG: hypothetical protein KF865_03380 [Bdellovibrionaceae bacterium]|nr:hypothetical protein [Pseudobdellovibrionaceae bacterium]
MKKILLLVATLALSMSAYAAETNPLAGTYSECVKWTVFNGVLTSKKFEMVYGEDRSLVYRIGFYNNTDKCEGDPIDAKSYSDFEVIKDLDGSSVRFMDLKEKTENLYFEIVVSKDKMSVTTSDKYPVEIQMTNFIVLPRKL